jgi:hypothetical protein
MFFVPHFVRRRWLSEILAIILVLSTPAPANALLMKNHLTISGGFQSLLSNNLQDKRLAVDSNPSGSGSFAYRFSLSRWLDLTLDACVTTLTQSDAGTDLTLTGSYYGPGIRFIAPREGARPFVQANFLIVQENIHTQTGNVTVTTTSGTATGFGLSAGLDIRASNLISFPIEVDYMYGKPADDMSSVGLDVGLTFNFGKLKT